VKELRSVLQMSEGSDQALLKALDETKNEIGEWHDWEELLSHTQGDYAGRQISSAQADQSHC
jgi:hypothetical protein